MKHVRFGHSPLPGSAVVCAWLAALCLTVLPGCDDSWSNRGETDLLSALHVGEPAPPRAPAMTAASQENWSAFRGGDLQGVSPAAVLPTTWSAQQGWRWRRRLQGEGNSSPVVHGERLYVTAEEAIAAGEGKRALWLICLDAESGRLNWRRRAATVSASTSASTHLKNGHCSATVATDGLHVVANFGAAGLFCFDRQGNQLWKTSLGGQHQWGAASSPLIEGGLAIQLHDVAPGQSYLAAFDLASGAVVWKTPRDSDGAWCTPAVVTASRPGGGWRRELVINGTGSQDGSFGFVTAYDPRSGRELWRAKGSADIPVPTCIVGQVQDRPLVVSTSGANGPVMAICPGGDGDVTRSHTRWRSASGAPYVSTGLLFHERLYTAGENGVLRCYNAGDGKLLWRKRLSGSFSASLVAGAGKIYAVSEQGTTYVLSAENEGQVLAVNELHERCLATPAIAGGRIFIRGERYLYCIPALDSARQVTQQDQASPAADAPRASLPL